MKRVNMVTSRGQPTVIKPIYLQDALLYALANDNPAVGGHVLAEYGRLNAEGRLIYTECLTPICKECNDSYKNHQALKVFKVRGYHLCRVPNKPPKR